MAIQVCEVRASIVEKVKRKTLKCLSTTKTVKKILLYRQMVENLANVFTS